MMETKTRKPLAQWRAEAGLTQIELAAMAGCSASLVREIEAGKASPDTPMGRQIALVLDLDVDQILRKFITRESSIPEIWADDGYREDAPRNTLKWWREKRAISQADLERMSGVGGGQVNAIERGKRKGCRPSTRRKLAAALRVAPSKLILPGEDATPAAEKQSEEHLRAELRDARRALRKAYDFIVDDAAITFRYQERRDALLPEIRQKLRGT